MNINTLTQFHCAHLNWVENIKQDVQNALDAGRFSTADEALYFVISLLDIPAFLAHFETVNDISEAY